MIAAASWAQRSYGAQLVQHVRNYDTHVQRGDMDVQLIPFDPQESYQRHPIRDANLLAGGASSRPSGTASWAPTADLWDRARIPAVGGTFSESGISYNDLSAASWGHEYYQGVTPWAWWFQGARPSRRTAGGRAGQAPGTFLRVPPIVRRASG